MRKIDNCQQAYDLLKPIFEEAQRKGYSFRSLLEGDYQKTNYLFDNYIDEQFNHQYKNNPLMWTSLIARIGDYLEDSNKLSPTVIENAIEDSKRFFRGKSTFVVPVFCKYRLKSNYLKINNNLAICGRKYLLDFSQSLSKSKLNKLKNYGGKDTLFFVFNMDGKELLLTSHSVAVYAARDFCELFNVASFTDVNKLNRIHILGDKNTEEVYDFIGKPFLIIKNKEVKWAKWHFETDNKTSGSKNNIESQMPDIEEILSNSNVLKWFKYLSPTFPELLYKNEDKYSLIKQAILWLSESLDDSNLTNRFLKLIIALEILLERKSNFNKGEEIYHQLDENTDLILSLNNKEANEFFQNISKGYKLRSEIVHNGYKTGLIDDFELYKYLFTKSKEIINRLLLGSEFKKLVKTEEIYHMLDNIKAQRIKFLVREIIFALQKANGKSLSMKALKIGMSDNYKKYHGTEWFWMKVTNNNGFYVLNDWLIYKAISRLKNSSIIVEKNNKLSLTEIGESLDVKNIRFKAALDSILKNSDNKKKS